MSVVPAEVSHRAAAVRLLVLDVDGVLTDGSLWYGPEGEALKRFHVRDGMGIRLLRHFGVHTAVISARASSLVQKRVQDLRIEHWSVGKDDKRGALADIAKKLSLSFEQIAYLGDDILDVPVMRQVGLPMAVADAHPCAREAAVWVTPACGGNGAVREVADLILAATGDGAARYEEYLAGVAALAVEKF